VSDRDRETDWSRRWFAIQGASVGQTEAVGDQQQTDDPGWPPWSTILLVLIPGGLQLSRRKTRANALVTLRMVLLSFSAALVMFGVILPILGVPKGTVLPWLPLLIAGAFVSVLGVQFTVKPLDCSSATKLAESYRTRFFLVIAFSELVSLFAFVFVFVRGPLWIYYLGAAFALYRFWTAYPPTRAGIARDQERLDANGCELSLVAALRGEPTSAPRSPTPPSPPVPPFPPRFPPSRSDG